MHRRYLLQLLRCQRQIVFPKHRKKTIFLALQREKDEVEAAGPKEKKSCFSQIWHAHVKFPSLHHFAVSKSRSRNVVVRLVESQKRMLWSQK